VLRVLDRGDRRHAAREPDGIGVVTGTLSPRGDLIGWLCPGAGQPRGGRAMALGVHVELVTAPSSPVIGVSARRIV
jgi:hypothetical protein